MPDTAPHYEFLLNGAQLCALPSGALFWPDEMLLCVSDLHFGKAQRYARGGGAALPPYETQDTLLRLEQDLARTGARCVVCLGDSFDTPDASTGLHPQTRDWITRLQAGRRWVWIEGNHDPGPLDVGGTHLADLHIGPLLFRHIAEADAETGEISGHYHPKARLNTQARRMSRPCFLLDQTRLILPAYGTYTGGLDATSAPLDRLIAQDALCILTGKAAHPVPRSALSARR